MKIQNKFSGYLLLGIFSVNNQISLQLLHQPVKFPLMSEFNLQSNSSQSGQY